VAKFTSSEVSGLKKRLKALKEGVRADKNKSNNSALMEVGPSIFSVGIDGVAGCVTSAN